MKISAIIILVMICLFGLAGCIQRPICGNGLCEAGEITSCPADCGIEPEEPVPEEPVPEEPVEKIDLSDYPSMFIDDGNYIGLLVVGKDAPATDVLALTNIAMGLQAECVTVERLCSENGACQEYERVNRIPSTVNKIDTSIIDPRNYYLISVGTPCVNVISADLMGNPDICSDGIEVGNGYLNLFHNGDRYQLVVYGGTGEDTIYASKILQNHEDYDLDGMKMVLTTETV